jgi:hypothetical protein
MLSPGWIRSATRFASARPTGAAAKSACGGRRKWTLISVILRPSRFPVRT